MPARAPLPLTLLLTALAAAPLAAQPAGPQNPAGGPLDAGVADRGPHATSLRRVEPGNAQHSFAARIQPIDFSNRWTPLKTDPQTGLTHSAQYQFRSPGLRALLDQPQYAQIQGQTLALIPANTVFQLTPEPAVGPAGPTPPTPPPPHANFRDMRLNLRLADQPTPPIPSTLHTPGDPFGTTRLDTSAFRFPAAADAAYLPVTPDTTPPRFTPTPLTPDTPTPPPPAQKPR